MSQSTEDTSSVVTEKHSIDVLWLTCLNDVISKKADRPITFDIDNLHCEIELLFYNGESIQTSIERLAHMGSRLLIAHMLRAYNITTDKFSKVTIELPAISRHSWILLEKVAMSKGESLLNKDVSDYVKMSLSQVVEELLCINKQRIFPEYLAQPSNVENWLVLLDNLDVRFQGNETVVVGLLEYVCNLSNEQVVKQASQIGSAGFFYAIYLYVKGFCSNFSLTNFVDNVTNMKSPQKVVLMKKALLFYSKCYNPDSLYRIYKKLKITRADPNMMKHSPVFMRYAKACLMYMLEEQREGVNRYSIDMSEIYASVQATEGSDDTKLLFCSFDELRQYVKD